MRRCLTLLCGLVMLTGAAVATAGSAAAAGYDGICTGSDALTGVTVVIDFQELDGNGGVAAPTIVRCSPNPSPGTNRTGLQALQDAGISVAGTVRWGLDFVCRLQNRPASTETIPITTNPTYQEPCLNTPPASAFWSYWHAGGTGTTWTFSSFGHTFRNVIPGGFEGWSFSLNKTATTNPPPGVAPCNPAIC